MIELRSKPWSTQAWLAPRLSAISFVYGAERFIGGLLDDLLRQTMISEMEVIIVDTGSPTDEQAVVREYIEERAAPNIIYQRIEERESTTAAANRALALARGKYLTLAMADDRHRPDALELLCGELDHRPDVDLVYADCAVTEAENEDPVTTLRVTEYLSWPDFDARKLWSYCYVGPQPVYRRSLHERFGSYDPSYLSAGDYEFWLRCVAGGAVFHHVPEVLGLYLRRSDSVEHRDPRRMSDESDRARELHWPAAWGPYRG